MSETHPNKRQGDEAVLHHQLKEEKRLLEIEQNIKSLEDKIDTLQKDVSDLVTAWKAASWLVNVIRVLGGVATAIAALYSLIKLKG